MHFQVGFQGKPKAELGFACGSGCATGVGLAEPYTLIRVSHRHAQKMGYSFLIACLSTWAAFTRQSINC